MLDTERAEGGNRAILVHMDIYDEVHRENLSEFKELVVSSGAGSVPKSMPTKRRMARES